MLFTSQHPALATYTHTEPRAAFPSRPGYPIKHAPLPDDLASLTSSLSLSFTSPRSSLSSPVDSPRLPLQFPRHLPKPPPESPAFTQRPTYYGPGALNSSPLQPEMSDTRLPQTVLRDAFFKTRSRVVRFFMMQPAASIVLSTMFSHPSKPPKTPCPLSMWSKVDEATVSGVHEDSFWAIFESHEETCAALSLSCALFHVSPALESELTSSQKLRRFEFGEASVKEAVAFHPSAPSPIDHNTSAGHTISPLSTSNPYMRRQDTLGSPADSNPTAYTISSNPPNPKTSFRIGDWICSGINCAAHNFGRNVACIVCGRSRPAGPQIGSIPQDQPSIAQQVNHLSPRFAAQLNPCDEMRRFQASMPVLPSAYSPLHPACPAPHAPSALQRPPASMKTPGLSYPPLTPSGRALSVGGRVRNVSMDPLAPCVMYWPDNEPLPEQGQIRPIDSAVMSYPPIINTGNKGAAEKQPGDWVCSKCNYLNWRRRKVCQTCFPYAEGNGDSISAAVQAERIALLTSLLSTQLDSPQQHDGQTSAIPSGLPGHATTDQAPPFTVFETVPRSQPPLYAHDKDAYPIYQTSGHRASASLASYTVPLLPSFLQDIVQEPSLSPSSSASSAELSLAESDDASFHDTSSAGGLYEAVPPARPASSSTSSFHLRGASIWKMDGEESKTLATPTTPTTAVYNASQDDAPGRSQKS